MKKIYILKESKKLRKISDYYYHDLLEILQKKSPEAEALIEDNDLYQLNLIATFIKLGHLKVSRIESYDLEGYLALEVSDG